MPRAKAACRSDFEFEEGFPWHARVVKANAVPAAAVATVRAIARAIATKPNSSKSSSPSIASRRW
jgi:hypothetical protein